MKYKYTAKLCIFKMTFFNFRDNLQTFAYIKYINN